MINEHLSEEEIQQLAMGALPPGSQAIQHSSTCASCKERVAVYRTLVQVIEGQPAAVFHFNISEMVLAQLAPPVKKETYSRVAAAIPALLIAGMCMVPLFLFRKNFSTVLSGVSFFFLAAGSVAGLIAVVFKTIHMYHSFNQKIKELEILK